ncbi:MAG: carboxypeptidase-like regulatory domain-containing protein, partial [Acidobacteriota bacterium]
MGIWKRVFLALVCCLCGAISALAQSDRGTITGTIADASGALIPGAKITVTNSETGTVAETVATSTGSYTVPSLPVGTYTLRVEHAGFNTTQETGIKLQVAVTTRHDIVLQVGSATQSVDVSAENAILKTESAEQSTTITGDTINELPLNFSIGAGAVRNPLSFVQLTPGATISGWNTIKVNGNPTGTFRILFEGQESSSGLDARVSDEVQPSVEAIQEFTLQTSNFAAEFGQVAGGLFNFTSRSGTNQLHGSAYMYGFNEVLNAGIPFTDNGRGEHIRPARKVYDGGFSVGGPVVLPKIYNGRNRTFFFWNWEKYQDRNRATFGVTTVPTDALRGGDFSSLLTGKTIGTDIAGRPIPQNAIYDPQSQTTNAAGQFIRQIFPGNVIPASRIDPVAAKILATLPKPNFGNNLVNNYQPSSPFRKIQTIPSLKIDHNINDKSRISGYWSQENTDKDVGQDGLPDPISIRRDLSIKGRTLRVNYDQTLSPSLLLHLGAGVQRYINPDSTPASIAGYDEAGLLGLKGTPGTGFPRITGLGDNTYGGMALQVGPTNRGIYLQVKPTAVAQLTWIRGNHTYKTGGEWKIDSFTNRSSIGLS